MADLSDAEYTIYSGPFSLYSAMARHSAVLGLTTHDARPPKKIDLHFVAHHKNKNLDEYYLKINPKGQVPAMTGSVLEEPLTDSISISLYLAEKHYPAMLPAEHATTIRDLLERIHAIYGLSIVKKNPPKEVTEYNPSPAEEILKRTDISPEYRKALETKLEFHDKNNATAFQPAVVARARADLQAIMAEITEHRRRSGAEEGEWTFGAAVGPTVLDSHLLPLVLRCVEVGNAELIPDELQRWAEAAARGPAWQKVMHGRPTVYNPSMGPIEDMQDMMSL